MLPFYYYGFTGVKMIQPYGQAELEIAGVQLVTSMIHGQGEILDSTERIMSVLCHSSKCYAQQFI